MPFWLSDTNGKKVGGKENHHIGCTRLIKKRAFKKGGPRRASKKLGLKVKIITPRSNDPKGVGELNVRTEYGQKRKKK